MLPSAEDFVVRLSTVKSSIELPDARYRLYTLRTVLLDKLCLRATADRLLVDSIDVSSSWSAGSPVE